MFYRKFFNHLQSGDFASGNFMFKKIISGLIDQPLLTSIYIVDLAILLLHRPPFIFSLVMMSALIAMSMYFGQKLELFKK